ETAARRVGGGAHADDERTSARVCVNDARARSRTSLIVQDLEPLTIVERTQRFGGHAFQPPDVLFAAMRERRVLEGDGQPLGTSLVLAGFGLERGAQRRGEAAPAPTGQPREVLLEHVDTWVGLERIGIFRRQRYAIGVHDDANGAWLAIRRPRIL